MALDKGKGSEGGDEVVKLIFRGKSPPSGVKVHGR